MEIKIRTEAKIGFIVLSTIVLVIWGINFLKGKNILKRTDVYYAVFDNVQGLEYAAPVFISGYKVGLINSINFDKNSLDRFVVAFAVEKKYNIPKGSAVRIASPGIIASKSLMIDLAISSEIHSFGDTLITTVHEELMDKIQKSIDPIIKNAERSLVQIDSLLTVINRTFDENTSDNLKLTVKNTSEISTKLNNQLAGNGDLAKTLSNLEEFTASLSSGREKLTQTLSNIESITDTLANAGIGETIENMTNVSNELHILLHSMNSGEGTLGMLAKDDSLYVKLVDVSSSLDLLLIDMKERPKRYVHFSIFGKKDK